MCSDRDKKLSKNQLQEHRYQPRVTEGNGTYLASVFSVWADSDDELSHAPRLQVRTHHWHRTHEKYKPRDCTFRKCSGCRPNRETIPSQSSPHVYMVDKAIPTLLKEQAERKARPMT